MSHDDSGIADVTLVNKVSSALNDESIRPLNDTVLVQSAGVVEYNVSATLKFYPGVHKELSLKTAKESLDNFVRVNHRLGRDITLSGITHALKQEGVQDVIIEQPTANIVISKRQAAFCNKMNVIDGGYDE